MLFLSSCRCSACGKEVGLTRKGVVAVHQAKGGKLCPKSATVFSTCDTGKVQFQDEGDAENAATSTTRGNLRHIREPGRTAARPYQCDQCGKWHVTSQPMNPSFLSKAVHK